LWEIQTYVTRDKPVAAERLAMRIVAAVETLQNYPNLGRRGSQQGTRELVIGKTPCLVVYRVRGNAVIVGTIWHAAQKRKSRG
jgi:toxin ParE1/3/4